MFLFVVISTTILEIQGMTLAFWLVLFTTACFANVLGLNISAAFNSAVTVYILIPLLLIPQMILSGLLFNFDKLNNAISQKGKVPFVADMVASRWAYEAMAVYQYKNNKYEAIFYNEDQAKSQADYKSSYLADELKKRNQFVLDNYTVKNDSVQQLVAYNLYILESTLKSEPTYTGTIPSLKTYTDALGRKVDQDLETYRSQYKDEYNKKELIAERKMNYLESHNWNITENKNRYFNESLSDLVRNIDTKNRILEHEGKLIQQIDPIYQNALPKNILDYRTIFFCSNKNLLGLTVDTYTFNMLVIWFMTLTLFVTLYFEVLTKALNIGSKIKSYKN